ncbi:MAG TPA: 4-(cytidine 5'-diphospho)-2-C-methyl-D-erythritol kinase [Sulfuricurvum sp.]|nr:MAG: 4-(cytidine 5'-diphospho)-2-C-methyl-D-erythritol kinase [Campylobacterales bacterium 16-40-21]OZA02988.1 MAG: 4-(cytidine 5'-diphospho)-2-C-methyl-D-erythritol kinase [Sulfuricurvum sp. 17-40-25]HQS66929.1 4-(cytidine 5'-diphospho)-2-C-methyl-D-erythritol kinase [Sulfuricurvum sp.]HQT35667.1 4-(cytidine 5'-diphospho)-2-C-methyl-D-erythritol kinase [Sulfuricurvum sp.]
MTYYNAFAKVNIFLKITGKRGDYHTITSRFMRVNTLYDTLWFEEKEAGDFELRGDFTCPINDNTIYKAYKALLQTTQSKELLTWMQTHALCVEKRIPSFAGLGGGSSDAATFLNMCNDILALGLTHDELARIGATVGADVPFFIYGYESANVSGIGEIVQPFHEPLLEFEINTPSIQISTPTVYSYYRQHLYSPISAQEAILLEATPSRDILARMDPKEANDLYLSALGCYSELSEQDGWFFSGSGSSFFRLKEPTHG